jgi:hypothetical protein
VPIGFALATLLHGFFNFYIFTIGSQNFFLLILPIVPLAVIALLISLGFQELKILWNPVRSTPKKKRDSSRKTKRDIQA